jgi:hypothetical protein
MPDAAHKSETKDAWGLGSSRPLPASLRKLSDLSIAAVLLVIGASMGERGRARSHSPASMEMRLSDADAALKAVAGAGLAG